MVLGIPRALGTPGTLETLMTPRTPMVLGTLRALGTLRMLETPMALGTLAMVLINFLREKSQYHFNGCSACQFNKTRKNAFLRQLRTLEPLQWY